MATVRIAGVTLPNKQVEISLTAIFGIGRARARALLLSAGVESTRRANDLSEDEVNKLRTLIEGQYKIEGELRREVLGHIKRLKDISSYRGSRHAKHLPLRGQRTRTNSRTVRGNTRKTMGSGRRALTKT